MIRWSTNVICKTQMEIIARAVPYPQKSYFNRPHPRSCVRASQNHRKCLNLRSCNLKLGRPTNHRMRPKQSFPHSRKPQNSGTDGKACPVCYCCGESGHKAKNPSCPALKAPCNPCHKIGHFSCVCQSSKKKISKVGEVPCPDDSDDSVSDEHVFVVRPYKHDKNVIAVISSIVIDMMIDSGERKCHRFKCISKTGSNRRDLAEIQYPFLYIWHDFTTGNTWIVCGKHNCKQVPDDCKIHCGAR